MGYVQDSYPTDRPRGLRVTQTTGCGCAWIVPPPKNILPATTGTTSHQSLRSFDCFSMQSSFSCKMFMGFLAWTSRFPFKLSMVIKSGLWLGQSIILYFFLSHSFLSWRTHFNFKFWTEGLTLSLNTLWYDAIYRNIDIQGAYSVDLMTGSCWGPEAAKLPQL